MDHDPTRRSTYQKIYKTRFQGTQVEALKDIHFTVEKGEYVAIMGNQDPGNPPLLNILAMLDQPTEGRVYLNGTDTSTIKNKDASELPPGKTRLCLSRLQPARHLICQGQYPPALGPFPQTSQGNDE